MPRVFDTLFATLEMWSLHVSVSLIIRPKKVNVLTCSIRVSLMLSSIFGGGLLVLCLKIIYFVFFAFREKFINF